MKENKFGKNEVIVNVISIVVIVVAFVCVTFGIFGNSYGFFSHTDTGSSNVITFGDMGLDFQTINCGASNLSIGDDLAVNGANVPTDASTALNENNACQFTITNTGTLPLTIKILLISSILTDSSIIGNELEDNIYVAIQEVGAGTPLITLLSDIEDNMLGNTVLEAEEEKTYNIWTWVSEDAPNTIQGTTLTTNIKVQGQYIPYSEMPLADTVTITFDNLGGTGGQTGNVTATYGEAMPTISSTAPTKAGYTFGGYYTQPNGKGTKYYDASMNSVRVSNMITDKTLYAYWEVILATIVTTDTGSDNTLNLKMKQLANPSESITSGYGFIDYSVKSFKRANENQYNTIKNSLTNDNIISTLDSPVPVYMWFDDSTGTMYWYTEALKVKFVGTMGRLFAKYRALEDISSFADFDTSEVTDMNRLFQYDISLSNISALASWDTSKVTTLRFAFGGDDAGGSMIISDYSPISGWDVGKVEDFNQAFKWNIALTNLDAFKDWDMTSAKDISQMFNGSSALSDATGLKKWNVVNVSLEALNGTNNGFYRVVGNTPLLDKSDTSKVPPFEKRPGTWDTNGSYTPN